MQIEDRMTTAADRDFISVGQLAAHVQKPVRRIEAAAEQLRLKPAMRLNGVPYFDGAQVERLTAKLQEQRSK
jgi:hypothetical protein